jgi:diguanylate cyclase (GGDEF)-like protein
MFSQTQLETILASLPDPAFVITRSGKYAAAFGGKDSRFYHDGSRVVGKTLREIFHDDAKCAWLLDQVVATLAEKTLYVTEYALSRDDLREVAPTGPPAQMWFEARIQPLPFLVDGEDAVLWVASNITWRHDIEDSLRRQNETDPLTGLLNRRYVERVINKEGRLASADMRPVSILIADIDHFKAVNDRYGHLAGDEVLVSFAAMLKDGLRATDIAARWGGEEFIILLPETKHDEALEVAERLRALAENASYADGIKATISIGLAARTGMMERTEVLILRADEALYRAKNEGRNRVVSSARLSAGAPSAR